MENKNYNKNENDNDVYHVNQIKVQHLPLKEIKIASKTNIITMEDVETYGFDKNYQYKVLIPDCISTIDDEAFTNCYISEIEIPPSVTKIGSLAFSENYISNFKCPQGITHIESGTYVQNNIMEIEIPAHIKEIGSGAFCGNPIKKIVLNNQDCEIGEEAFFVGDCLLELHLKGFTTPPKHIQEWFWGDTPADELPEYLRNCVLYIPKGTTNLYKEYEEEYPHWSACLADHLEEVTGSPNPNPYTFFKDIVEE